MQRSIIALLQGDIYQSLKYHPATVPLLLCLVISICTQNGCIPKNERIKRNIFLVTLTLFACNYLIKIILPAFA
ncbi:DUF2752 domain-containing protein [Mucilaginibacter sp. RB4R14]|uniref:DUF2752 domain-containing protein n=1 Tax=Mucilaginibacter aurantiaciroseus TaxID=2949308 RepID=UPI00209162B3|nr:DUF2752 domain-containing protein [Mucilaginibacter aurantiaciroseus]